MLCSCALRFAAVFSAGDRGIFKKIVSIPPLRSTEARLYHGVQSQVNGICLYSMLCFVKLSVNFYFAPIQ